MILKLNFSKAIQILLIIAREYRKHRSVSIDDLYKETKFSMDSIRKIIKILQKKGFLKKTSMFNVSLKVDPCEINFRHVKDCIGKEDLYDFHPPKYRNTDMNEAIRYRMTEKFKEATETLDFYWEHLTLDEFQRDIHSRMKLTA